MTPIARRFGDDPPAVPLSENDDHEENGAWTTSSPPSTRTADPSTATPASSKPKNCACSDLTTATSSAGTSARSASRPGRRSNSKARGGFLPGVALPPVPTPAEERRLAQRVERGDPAAKDELVAANLRLVQTIAGEFARKLAADSGLEPADLFQQGTLGLIRAVERFDWRCGERLGTYAGKWIRGAIKAALTEKSRLIRLPEHVVEQHAKIDRAQREIEAAMPELRQGSRRFREAIAERAGVSVEEVDRSYTTPFVVLSLDAPAVNSDGESCLWHELQEDPGLEGDATADTTVAMALDALPELERRVVTLRWGIDPTGWGAPHTIKETAGLVGVDRREVPKIEARGLARMRAAMGADE